jgi:shikimate dehydrogenase
MTENTIKQSLGDFDVVIHATKVGMYPHCGEMLFDPNFLAPSHIVCDVVYVPVETRLLQEAARRGCRTLSGLWMNVNQAAEQMRIWLGIEPPLDFMYEGSADFLKSQGKYKA